MARTRLFWIIGSVAVVSTVAVTAALAGNGKPATVPAGAASSRSESYPPTRPD